MVSSGDEFASYDQSPRVNPQPASNPVAGPSTKRNNALSPTDGVGNRNDPAEPISISSGDEGARPATARRGKAPFGPGSNGRSISSKGKGKVPTRATAKRRKIADESDAGGVEENAAETDDDVGMSRGATRPLKHDTKGKNRERLHEQVLQLQKKLDDVTQQRDTMSRQLDEMFRLRPEMEKLIVDQKTQYEARLKAQEDTIQELHASLSRVDALSQPGGTTSLHFLTRETADEEKQDVQREVSKLKKTIKGKDTVIAEKDIKIKELDDTIQVLRADLKTEIENTKALTSRNVPSSGSKHTSKPGDLKHALVIRVYEELTGILITNVKHEPGQYKEDDAIYTCVQTIGSSNNKSLSFNLKFFQEPEEGETPITAMQNERLVDKVIYTPLHLDRETKEFVAQLDFLAGPFTFQKSQMNVFMKTLTSYLEGDNDESQSNVSQMEAEDD